MSETIEALQLARSLGANSCRTNICLKEIDRLKGELEEYKKICDTWETIDKQSNALLSTVKAALEQEERHTMELCQELASYKAWVEAEGEYTTVEVAGRVDVAIVPDSIPAVFCVGQRVRVLVRAKDWV